MKIAIQGHPIRGKEVIQILESLGGVNRCALCGNSVRAYYYIDYNNNLIHCHLEKCVNEYYKKYTLEEFEKEFPFKIGDEVIFPVINGWASGKITSIKDFEYEVNTKCGYRYVEPHKVSLYPMKKERNITLTLEKAKEWYNKGGELKEIALQAFTEKELNTLPRSWEEYCRKYGYVCLSTRYTNIPLKYDALLKLEQLRDCYRGLFVTVIGMPVWNISMYDGKPHIFQAMWGKNQSFLSFQSREIAEEYLRNFKPLIEKAGDLI